MSSVRLVVRNPSGLHARPAALFVKTAGRFDSKISVRNVTNNGAPADAKSILGVLTVGASKGAEIEVTAEGVDAHQAIETISRAVEDGLGESLAPDP
jgi:phosphotransferase system HPr (HPr) family protein